MTEQYAVASDSLAISIDGEVTVVLGSAGPCRPAADRSVALVFDADPLCFTPALTVVDLPQVSGDHAKAALVLWVGRSTLEKVGLQPIQTSCHSSFHLPSEIRAVIMAMRECQMTDEALAIYRKAKAMELLCETARVFQKGDLLPFSPSLGLSAEDVRRLMSAKRMVDDNPTEKHTLEKIARACGLNRAKLTRGFRNLFDCSIAEALMERRLDHARKLLLTTDLPVASVGYACGYDSNASFARAFGRRFGMPPSNCRAMPLAA